MGFLLKLSGPMKEITYQELVMKLDSHSTGDAVFNTTHGYSAASAWWYDDS